MRQIKEFFWRRGLKQALPSRHLLRTSDPKVTVLTSNHALVEVVKEYFTAVDFIYFENMRRPKGEILKTYHLYKDDISLRGEPKRFIPDPGDNHIILNLENDSPNLTWYWYARSYDIRVDLCGIYENADLSIKNPNISLKEQLAMLKNMLKVMTTNE